MLNKFAAVCRWIVKHWAVSLAVFLVIAIGVTTIVCWNAFGKEKKDIVPIYITVTGMGEGKDMKARELMVEENATVAEIFSMDYPEIYEAFQQPLVMNNTFMSFQGVRPEANKKFYVKINGTYENNLIQAYTYYGCDLVIEYR